MASNGLECGICSNVYSEDHLPRILPCSHTVCGFCIDHIIETDRRFCPFCRTEFEGDSSEDLIFNRLVLDATKQITNLTLEPRLLTRNHQGSFLDYMKGIWEHYAQKGIAECQGAEAKILDFIEVLNGMKKTTHKNNKEIQELMKVLQQMKASNDKVESNIDQCTNALKDRLGVALQSSEKIKDSDTKLKAATNFTAAGTVMDEGEEILNDAQEEVKEIEEFLQRNEKVTEGIRKKILNTQIILGNITTEVEKKINDIGPVKITENILRSLCGPLKSYGEKDIYALKIFEGRRRVARVKIMPGNQVFLSRLEDGDIPSPSYCIMYESLMRLAPRRVFLDLNTEDFSLGRIVIKLVDEGALALNFLHMCAGDLGPSYANSNVLGVGHKGRDGENIGMGEYLVEGGTSTDAVVSDVDWERDQEEAYENTPHKAGEVRVWFSYHNASRFYIVTRDHPGWVNRCCFGMVEEGLDDLRDTIMRYPDIEKIKISDCGLIFSFEE